MTMLSFSFDVENLNPSTSISLMIRTTGFPSMISFNGINLNNPCLGSENMTSIVSSKTAVPSASKVMMMSYLVMVKYSACALVVNNHRGNTIRRIRLSIRLELHFYILCFSGIHFKVFHTLKTKWTCNEIVWKYLNGIVQITC